jgi:hypothetical protein
MNNQGDILQQLTPEQIMMLQALLSGSGGAGQAMPAEQAQAMGQMPAVSNGAPPQMMQQQAGMNPAARQKMIQELMRR